MGMMTAARRMVTQSKATAVARTRRRSGGSVHLHQRLPPLGEETSAARTPEMPTREGNEAARLRQYCFRRRTASPRSGGASRSRKLLVEPTAAWSPRGRTMGSSTRLQFEGGGIRLGAWGCCRGIPAGSAAPATDSEGTNLAELAVAAEFEGKIIRLGGGRAMPDRTVPPCCGSCGGRLPVAARVGALAPRAACFSLRLRTRGPPRAAGRRHGLLPNPLAIGRRWCVA